MRFFDAKEIFRRSAGGTYEQPDIHRSVRKADGWRLRDYQGRLLAIVSESARSSGLASSTTHRRDLTMWQRKDRHSIRQRDYLRRFSMAPPTGKSQ